MVNARWEASLPIPFPKHDLKDIYNTDKFGMPYQSLPDKTYHLKLLKYSGGKLSEIRITGMAAANTVSDKLAMFVIGKVKRPWSFRNNILTLPLLKSTESGSETWAGNLFLKEEMLI